MASSIARPSDEVPFASFTPLLIIQPTLIPDQPWGLTLEGWTKQLDTGRIHLGPYRLEGEVLVGVVYRW